ncbi:hypothetical protein FGO68_gene2929 [Halteria grandinella]|uniref:Uncharacterized protein n=1 Tax=Halteria grandinella TaxID=5974 RepID=A0A8J8SWS6_HALGN|nr:hypothetical protein FGO68_gene2929 [Halteria grandinella]
MSRQMLPFTQMFGWNMRGCRNETRGGFTGQSFGNSIFSWKTAPSHSVSSGPKSTASHFCRFLSSTRKRILSPAASFSLGTTAGSII